jgi:predicted transposase/invertase (TIGR01784 family)
MAAALLQEISKDEQERARFRSRRMFETDMASNLLTAERKGVARGRTEVAKTMRAEGMDINTVARLTGLTVDDILRL